MPDLIAPTAGAVTLMELTAARTASRSGGDSPRWTRSTTCLAVADHTEEADRATREYIDDFLDDTGAASLRLLGRDPRLTVVAVLDFRLLGPLEVVGDGGRALPLGAGRQRALLA